MLMVKRSILNQEVVNCDGAILLECPRTAVHIFNTVNSVRTKQKSFTRRTNPLKFIVVLCTGKVFTEMKTFTAGMFFFISCICTLVCIVFIHYF